MKAFVNICLKLSVVLLVIGIVLCIIGAGFGAVNGFRQFFLDGGYTITFNDSKDIEIEQEDVASLKDSTESFAANQIKNIEVTMKYGEINVYSYEGDEIKIDTKNPTKYFTCKQEGDTLFLIDNRSYKGAFKIGINGVANHTRVNVYIPEYQTFSAVEFKLDAGQMQVKDLKAEVLTVDVGAGEFEGENIMSKEASTLSVGAGYFQIVDSSLNNLALDVGTGAVEFVGNLTGDNKISCGLGSVDVDLIGEETDYNYDIQSDIGEVKIGKNTYSGLSHSQSVDYQAKDTIAIECGIGEVSISFTSKQ